MRRLQRYLSIALLVTAACGPEPLPTIPDPPGPKVREVHLADVGLDDKAMDRSVDPCVDFYQFACGGWEKSTEIPSDKPRWNRSFSEIHERNLADLESILEQAANGGAKGDLVLTKLGDFYAGCMDESGIESAGVTGVKELWEAAGNVKALLPDESPPAGDEAAPPSPGDANKGAPRRPPPRKPAPRPPEIRPQPPAPKATHSIEAVIARLHGHGVYAFFDFDSGQDFKDATKMIAHIDQNGLGLPDRDYYLDETKERQDIREYYRGHVARMLEMAGYDAPTAKIAAEDVLRIETELAKIAKSRVDRRDPKAMYNKIDRPGLRERSGALKWDGYFQARRLDHVADVSVTSVSYIEGLNRVIGELRQSELVHYLQWHVIRAFAEHLPKKFVDESFGLTAKLSGQAEIEPRWKRCVAATDGALGELLAQPYVERRFSEKSKAAVQKMVSEISEAFRSELRAIPWMGEATREQAAAKLDKMAYLIGYPDQWKTYDFTVDRAAHAANVVRAYGFEIQRSLAKIGKPVDRGEWHMTPPTVNAYYSPLKNQMVFPAGILQPPFFDPEANIAVNLGGMGMVVGHELTHGFDDQGSQFDGNGNLANWWDPKTREKFTGRTECMAQQYDAYEVLPGVRLNGKLTLGENIADAGGVKLAFQAYRRMRENAAEVLVADGFTEDQQFFISVGQVWCSKYRPEFAKMRATTDYHAQPNWRVNGSLANTSLFGDVFQCKEGTPMRPKTTCNVW